MKTNDLHELCGNRYYFMKTKGDSRRVNELIRALLRSYSKQMTYMNYTASSHYSMKQKEIGAATDSEFVTVGISNACTPNLTRLASREVHFFCKEEPAVRKGRPPLRSADFQPHDTAATSFPASAIHIAGVPFTGRDLGCYPRFHGNGSGAPCGVS